MHMYYSTKLCIPIERPLEQELACSLRELLSSFVWLKNSVDHTLQPGGPLLQGILLLQSRLEVLLET